MASNKGSKVSAMIDECEFFTPPDEAQKLAAAKVVCAFAKGDTHAEQIADARDLVRMLGLHPDQAADDDYVTGPPRLPNRHCV